MVLGAGNVEGVVVVGGATEVDVDDSVEELDDSLDGTELLEPPELSVLSVLDEEDAGGEDVCDVLPFTPWTSAPTPEPSVARMTTATTTERRRRCARRS